MKIAIIGQSVFGAEVYKRLRNGGHTIVGVFTIPDNNGKSDPLAKVAEEDGIRVFKFPRWRFKGAVVEEVYQQYCSVEADLNVLPYCTQFIPMEVINKPQHKSIIYHPSLLPKHRGASSINWTLIQGDQEAGFTIFWADDGLDTGPILLQRSCPVLLDDTVDTLYNRFLFPAGVDGVVEAVQLIAQGTAPALVQDETVATYEAILKLNSEAIRIAWNQPALTLHNFIRGHDKVPGAWTKLQDGEMVRLYGSQLWTGPVPEKLRPVTIEDWDPTRTAFLHKDGLLVEGSDHKFVNVTQIQFVSNNKMIPASKLGAQAENSGNLAEDRPALNEAEQQVLKDIQEIWQSILSQTVIDDVSDFFALGGQSMDVTRLVEAVKQKHNVIIAATEVYMATTLIDFVQLVCDKLFRSDDTNSGSPAYDPVVLQVNNLNLVFPHQAFINNKFVDSESGRIFQTINPATEEVICSVSSCSAKDVDIAVQAAHKAFYQGEWTKMSARDRGKLLFRLADLMEEEKDALATLESLDSGAVFTLALKTHVGMSIDCFRYFAGWCDKIQGATIPISHARPNKNFTFTKKEPIGVCGIITPWNYPLMMLAWKLAACLAAGNCVLLKPAQVTPLTSLKFCELVLKAGFPAGVINVLPGSGAVVGQAIAEHPLVRKIGFTGSTEVGKTIMSTCGSSNVKKVSLELGGKSPLIIFADADFDKAVRLTLSAVFFNKGENCIAAGRIFVEDTIYDSFVQRVVQETKKMKIGDPLDRSVDHGPQNHYAHLVKLLEYVQKGVQEGAKLVLGGQRLQRPGFFMEPTILIDALDSMFIAQEESFGPVMVISKFTSLEEVIARANSSEYGLAAGVFTRDLSKAMNVMDRLEAGTVFVNTYNKTDVAAPFGGFKQSGFGKDLGAEAINEYLKTKTVTMEY